MTWISCSSGLEIPIQELTETTKLRRPVMVRICLAAKRCMFRPKGTITSSGFGARQIGKRAFSTLIDCKAYIRIDFPFSQDLPVGFYHYPPLIWQASPPTPTQRWKSVVKPHKMQCGFFPSYSIWKDLRLYRVKFWLFFSGNFTIVIVVIKYCTLKAEFLLNWRCVSVETWLTALTHRLEAVAAVNKQQYLQFHDGPIPQKI